MLDIGAKERGMRREASMHTAGRQVPGTAELRGGGGCHSLPLARRLGYLLLSYVALWR